MKIEGILSTSGTSRSIESFSKSKFTSSTALTDSQLHTCIIIFFYFLQIYTELCYSALYMYLYIKKNDFHYVLREGTFSVFHLKKSDKKLMKLKLLTGNTALYWNQLSDN